MDLVVPQARYGVKNVIQNLLSELSDYDEVDPTYLTIPTNAAPNGVERITLLDGDRVRR